MSTAVRHSPVARLSSSAGAAFVEEAGWEIAASYGDAAAEREAIRASVTISDISARAKVDVRGEVGSVLPAAADALVAQVADDWALVLGPPGEEPTLLATLEAAAGRTTMVTDATHLHAGFLLAGPALPGLLERTTSWDPHGLAPGEAAAAPVVEIPGVLVRRDLGGLALEVYVPSEFARYAWETFSGTIGALGGRPVGWEVLRAEGWS